MLDKQRCTAMPKSSTASATSRSSKTRSDTKKEDQKRKAAAERKRMSRAKMSKKKKASERQAQKERYYRKKDEAGNRRNKAHSESDCQEKLRKVSFGRVMRNARKNLKQKRDRVSLCKLHFVNGLLAGVSTTVNRKNLYKRTTPRDNRVEQFYEQAGISLPGKKSVSTISMKGKKVLTKTVKCLFGEFRKKNPQYKISLTTFKRRRPQHILLSSSAAFRQCLCLHCVNPMLKAQRINPFLPHDLKIKHEDDLVERTMCKHRTFQRDCVDRNCRNCGVDVFFDSLDGKLPALQEPVTWFKWQKSDRSPMDQVKKAGTWEQLLHELREELNTLAKHLTTARWQRDQYQGLASSLPEQTAIVTIDFAENYLCRYQDEVQSAHWSYRQVSLCPSVLQYHCSSSCCSCVTEYVVAMSDDLNHDAAFGKKALSDILQHLEEKGIQHVHIWSDGCASQFKSKVPFIHMTELAAEHPNLVLQRHYFGAGHGKSLSDGCGGTVKGCATRAVASGRETIQSGSDMHKFCCENLVLPKENEQDHGKTHLQRSFMLYTADQFSRSKKAEDYVTLKGCRSIHQLKPKREVGELVYRHLSCFCSRCRDEDGCENEQFVGGWRNGSVKLKENKRQLTCFCSGCQAGDDCLNKQFVGEWRKGTITMKARKSTKAKKATKAVDVESTPPDESLSAMDMAEDETQNPAPSTGASLPSIHTHEVPPSPSTNQPKRPLAEMERTQHFQQLQEKLQATSSFEEFLVVSAESKPGLDKYPVSLITALTIDKLVKDKTATLLYPSDCPQLTPTKIYGDGNCLPRCASVLAFGHEENHLEMRVRIITEIANNSDAYFSNTLSSVVKDLPKKAAMYSEEFTGQVLTPKVVEEILKQDLRRSIKPGKWMGILHLYATATILNTSIESIYPEGVGYNVRGDLAHCVDPVRGSGKPTEYGIMWTHTRGFHGPNAAWAPNHFVVCVPPCFHSKLTASDFVLVQVPQEGGKNTAVPNLYVAELTTGEVVVPGHGRGAWGVFLVQCNRGQSWKRPNAGQGIFFCPLPDIKMVLEDYEMEQEGRSIVFTFQHA
ncbi:uncharacterized protein [Littorina saxatilis]